MKSRNEGKIKNKKTMEMMKIVIIMVIKEMGGEGERRKGGGEKNENREIRIVNKEEK